MALLGAAVDSRFFVGLGVAIVALGVLEIWGRKSPAISTAWSTAAVFGIIGIALLGGSLYVLFFTGGPLLGRFLLVLAALLPITYLLYIAFAIAYPEIGGRRAPGADRFAAIIERLNEPVVRRNGRK